MGIDTVLTILMLAAIALIIGGIALWRRGGQHKQVWLMLLLAGIVVGNILIWTVPDSAGTAPVDQARK